MKNALRIIINRYFGAENTRCSSKAVGGELPMLAMVAQGRTPRILVINPIKGLNFKSNFGGHSLSASSLCSPQETVSDKAIGVVALVCVLALAFIALGV